MYRKLIFVYKAAENDDKQLANVGEKLGHRQ